MIKYLKPMTLSLVLLMSTALSGCSVGLITGASHPVRVNVGTRIYSQGYYRPAYGYSARGYYDPYYDSFYGSPLNRGGMGSWSTFGSSNCDRYNCPSDVIRPATTQEALRPEDLTLDVNPDLTSDLTSIQP